MLYDDNIFSYLISIKEKDKKGKVDMSTQFKPLFLRFSVKNRSEFPLHTT